MSDIHGLQALIAMRRAGKKPASDILLTVSDDAGQAKYVTTYADTEGVIRSSDNIDTLDLRPLIGLCVVVCCKSFGDRENRLFQRLQQYASDVILLVADWADESAREFGLRWSRGGENKPYPEAA